MTRSTAGEACLSGAMSTGIKIVIRFRNYGYLIMAGKCWVSFAMRMLAVLSRVIRDIRRFGFIARGRSFLMSGGPA